MATWIYNREITEDEDIDRVQCTYKTIVKCGCGYNGEATAYNKCPVCEAVGEVVSNKPRKLYDQTYAQVFDNPGRSQFSVLRSEMYAGVNKYSFNIYTYVIDTKFVFNYETHRVYKLMRKRKFDQCEPWRIYGFAGSDIGNIPIETAKELIDIYNNRCPLWPYRYIEMATRNIAIIATIVRQPNLTLLLNNLSYGTARDFLHHVMTNRIKVTETNPVAIAKEILGPHITRQGLSIIDNALTDTSNAPPLNVISNILQTFGNDVTQNLIYNIDSQARLSFDIDNLSAIYMAEANGERKVAAKRLIKQQYIEEWLIRDTYRLKQLVERQTRITTLSEDELHRLHDELDDQYKAQNDYILQQALDKQIPRLQSYEWHNNDYKIVAPHSINDIIEEGDAMHHCVKSYAESVAFGETNVFFLRNIDNTRVATIEVDRNNNVAQVKGPCNKKPANKALNAVKKWAQTHGLAWRNW